MLNHIIYNIYYIYYIVNNYYCLVQRTRLCITQAVSQHVTRVAVIIACQVIHNTETMDLGESSRSIK